MLSHDEPAMATETKEIAISIGVWLGSPSSMPRPPTFSTSIESENVLAIYEDIERMSTPLRNRIRVTFARLMSSCLRVKSSALKMKNAWVLPRHILQSEKEKFRLNFRRRRCVSSTGYFYPGNGYGGFDDRNLARSRKSVELLGNDELARSR